MAKPFEQPNIQEVATPEVVVDEAATPLPAVTVAGVKAEAVEMDLTTIYKKRLGLFVDFLNGKYANGSSEERAEEQMKFITFFNSMLEAEYPVVEACLYELIRLIKKNPVTFSEENVREPYWAMKKKPNQHVVEPYLRLLTFFLSLSANITRKPAFIKGTDITTFLSFWNEKQAVNLKRFIYE